ncbi:MAG TPA: DUF2339 domain-containing protein [Longimicrobium sp.]|jgi:uncharacterized membrane protein|nr:DUF2339 domain-containing protein [Longimicrobium sp.]
MSPSDNESLQERLDRLERMVEELTRRLPPLPADAAAPPTVVHAPAVSTEPPREPGRIRAAVAERAREWMPDDGASPFSWDGQTWLNRLGIVLLLLGVALLFRYSIDMGWLTPGVRVGFGAAVGAVLTGLGLRMDERRRFGSVLLGGGIATFYITGWAAFNLYGLIGYAGAFAGMVAITAGAFGLALWRSQPPLAIVGAFGGLGTPLILGISLATPRGLALYTSAVLAWTVVPYLRRGWRAVLWTSMAFGWILLASYANAFSAALAASPAARSWMQGAAVFAWIVLGVLPLARRVASIAAARRAQPDGQPHERRWRDADALHWYGVSIVPPAMFVATTALVWRMGAAEWGALAAGAAAVYAAAAWALWQRDGRLARVLLFAAAVLLPAGCFGGLRSEALLVALAAQALVLHLLAAYGAGPAIRWLGHRGFTGVGAWVLFRLVENGDLSVRRVAADLAAIGAGFAISYVVRTRGEMLTYRIWAHVAVLGWVWRQLAQTEGGQGYATMVWGAWGLGLLLLAMRQGWPTAERVAIWTLLATVAKLFLVDLERLDPLFRVLLFLGFGAVFLYFSYSGAWKPRAEPDPEPAGRDA